MWFTISEISVPGQLDSRLILQKAWILSSWWSESRTGEHISEEVAKDQLYYPRSQLQNPARYTDKCDPPILWSDAKANYS